MNYEIKTYKGVGDVKFGMSRHKVHDLLGSNYEEIVRTKGGNPIDEYEELGLFVYYDKDGKCGAVELFSPCNPIFEGKELLNSSSSDVIEFLKKYDPKIKINKDGFISGKLGIGGYCPRIDDNSKFESIICFVKNYYQ